MSSACMCHVEGAFCFYCEVYSPEVTRLERERDEWRAEAKAATLRADSAGWEVVGYAEENETLRSAMMDVFQRARNDIARREGGQCYGTITFHDHAFAKRLVRDLQPILFPEVVE